MLFIKTTRYNQTRPWGGTIDFVSVESKSFNSLFRLYIKSLEYDVIFDALNVVSKYFGVMNKYHLFPSRLITVCHHPPFDKLMRYSKSDVSIFFTSKLKDSALAKVKDRRKMIVNEWYPDVTWYNEIIPMVSHEKKYDFLDNGKTSRDHDMFIRALSCMPDKKGIIVTDKNHKPSAFREGGNVELYFQDKPNDLTMLQLCMQSRVMMIPLDIKDDVVIGPIGYTSYMDAIALGMPICTNVNSSFADEIEKNITGTLFYHNVNSMYDAMDQSLRNYELYSENMRSFARTHTIDNYSNNIIDIIFDHE